MSKINFKEFGVFTDISKAQKDIVDARLAVSDNLYKHANGIAAHDLAMRIYHSDGEIELNEQDAALLQQHAKVCFTPLFIDSLNANLHE